MRRTQLFNHLDQLSTLTLPERCQSRNPINLMLYRLDECMFSIGIQPLLKFLDCKISSSRMCPNVHFCLTLNLSLQLCIQCKKEKSDVISFGCMNERRPWMAPKMAILIMKQCIKIVSNP